MRVISSEIGVERRGPMAGDGKRQAAPAGREAVAVIERRDLIRECLMSALLAAGYEAIAFPALDDWLAVADASPVSAVLLSCPERSGPGQIRQAMRRLSGVRRPAPVIILADGEEPGRIAATLNWGVRGYIPTNLSLEVAVEAIRLVSAGGIFVPVSCLAGFNPDTRAAPPGADRYGRLFTARQAAVIEGIRKGKANKTIAYELNLRESTIKVHIRNIMKKIKAKNRTEVAYITNNLVNSGHL